jgi:DNA primase
MFNILSILPGKKKQTASGWTSFNAICCHMRGHKVDKRGRGGIRFDGSNWIYHCFNCNYSCGFELGKSITSKTRELLKWCGVDEQEVQRWNLESLQHKNLLDFTQKTKKEKTLHFKSKKLPESELVEDKPEHKIYVDYLTKRKVDYSKYKFYVTPNDEGRNSNRIIIPYYYNENIVGHTSRFLDDRKPKYINDQQTGYVFGYDNQRKDWEVCILVEGIFDALSIDGCALMHDDISETQAQVISQLNKRIIFVPDRDKTGLKLCERALELGYSVSLPNWDESIKDVNDAVIKYGKLPTLLSILQNATASKIKIEMQRTKIGKRL